MNGSWPDRQRRRIGIGLLTLAGSWLVWTLTPGLPVLRAPRAPRGGETGGAEPVRPRVATARSAGARRRARAGLQCTIVRRVPLPGGRGRRRRPEGERPGLRGTSHSRPTASCRPGWSTSSPSRSGSPSGRWCFKPCSRPSRTASRSRGFASASGTTSTRCAPRASIRSPCSARAGSTASRPRRSPIRECGARWRRSARSSGETSRASPSGRPRILPDGRVGKFGWKAQFATLEEFVAAACANEIGLGTPRMEQAKPLAGVHGQPAAAAIGPDLDQTQFRALVAFVATLPRPSGAWSHRPPRHASRSSGAGRSSRGSAVRPATRPTWEAWRGSTATSCSIGSSTAGRTTPRPPTYPPRRSFPCPRNGRRPPLWGVADSAPYFHDGGAADPGCGDPAPSKAMPRR